jgi:hypothetical protein
MDEGLMASIIKSKVKVQVKVEKQILTLSSA